MLACKGDVVVRVEVSCRDLQGKGHREELVDCRRDVAATSDGQAAVLAGYEVFLTG